MVKDTKLLRVDTKSSLINSLKAAMKRLGLNDTAMSNFIRRYLSFGGVKQDKKSSQLYQNV